MFSSSEHLKRNTESDAPWLAAACIIIGLLFVGVGAVYKVRSLESVTPVVVGQYGTSDAKYGPSDAK